MQGALPGLPRGVEAVRRGGVLFLLNHTEEPAEVAAGGAGTDLLTPEEARACHATGAPCPAPPSPRWAASARQPSRRCRYGKVAGHQVCVELLGQRTVYASIGHTALYGDARPAFLVPAARDA